MCKWWGPKLAYDAIHQCLLMFGHGGYDRGLMEQRLRDVLGFQIGDGTAQIMKTIIQPTVAGLKFENKEYKGLLYAGLMITRDGPRVLEFNARFGDPETQVIMPRFDSSLSEVMMATIERNVDGAVMAWTRAFGAERVTRPQGTYLVWLDLRGLVPDDDPMAVLAVPDGVVPADGANWGAPGFVRLNLATTPEEAAEVVARVTALVGAVG